MIYAVIKVLIFISGHRTYRFWTVVDYQHVMVITKLRCCINPLVDLSFFWPKPTKSPAIANAKLFRLNFVVMPEIRALAVLPVKLQKPVKSYFQQATFG